MNPDNAPRLRIGELSRRTGVRADTLRAWERRYGLLRPERTDGGFRLYGSADERRVRAMKAQIDSGVSAAEAARLALASAANTGSDGQSEAEPLSAQPERLQAALEGFREEEANLILDEAFARLTVDAVADRIVLPAMRGIGERWRSGEVTVAQEHFATGVLRGRMLALGRNWGTGAGPLALLACPPGEHHDLGLVVFGVLLHSRGWRITYLGADTPIETIAQASVELHPDAIVLAALAREPFNAVGDAIASLSEDSRLLIAGAGATPDLAKHLGAEALDQDPVAASRELSASPGSP